MDQPSSCRTWEDPKMASEDKFSLRHVKKRIEELSGARVHFSNDCIGEDADSTFG